MTEELKWHRGVQRIQPDMAEQLVHWTSGGKRTYRIWGRYVLGAKNHYEYRVEYKLDTGWWPLGSTAKMREGQSLAGADNAALLYQRDNEIAGVFGPPTR